MGINPTFAIAVVIVLLLVLIVLQAKKPVKRGIQRPEEWPEPPTEFSPIKLARFMKIEDVPTAYYATGNAIVLNKTLLVYDGSEWVEPPKPVCPTCGKCW